jgi:hypothetical protein
MALILIFVNSVNFDIQQKLRFYIMTNKKQTGKNVASNAGKILSSDSSSAIQKKFAASALSQTKSKNQTSSVMEAEVSAILKSKKYSKATKQLAASLLSQSNKAR